ncbi:MAG: hypothetical protein ACJ8IR_09025 [Alphaproteobacteria bacterium]
MRKPIEISRQPRAKDWSVAFEPTRWLMKFAAMTIRRQTMVFRQEA